MLVSDYWNWRNSEENKRCRGSYRVRSVSLSIIDPSTYENGKRDVSDITKAPELLGGRVKALHPAVHGGLYLPPTYLSA